MDEILDSPEPSPELEKIYSAQAAFWGAVLGGPVALAYMISHNYKVFGQPAMVVNSRVLTMLVAILLMALPSVIPALEKFPMIMPLLIAFGGQTAVNVGQLQEIKNHRLLGGKFQPFWTSLLVSLASLLVSLILIALILGITEPEVMDAIWNLF